MTTETRIEFFCPHCGQDFNGPSDLLGQAIDCQECHKQFTVSEAPAPVSKQHRVLPAQREPRGSGLVHYTRIAISLCALAPIVYVAACWLLGEPVSWVAGLAPLAAVLPLLIFLQLVHIRIALEKRA